VVPVNIVNWIIQSLQISQHSFNILEAVLVLYRVYRACHLFDIIQILLDFIELVISINIINRIV